MCHILMRLYLYDMWVKWNEINNINVIIIYRIEIL